MDFSHTTLTDQQLAELEFQINPLEHISIQGLLTKDLNTYIDGRGDLTEIWSQPWNEENPEIALPIQHAYINTTHHGVSKGWHIHEQTTSQYTCCHGKLQTIFVDLRPNSPTYKQVNQLIIGTHNPKYIKIPPGVLKGWKSLHGDAILVNLLTSADRQDNYKYPWDTVLTDLWQPINS